MLVNSFLAWIQNAPARERSEAVAMLAGAYLAGALGGDTPEAAEAALTLVLDDPAPHVRRRLALAFADRRDAPRHIVLSLAADQSEVSALLIARSPLLTEADLIDLAAAGDRLVLAAIALRQDVTERVARAVVERRELSSACTLVANPMTEIDEADLLFLVGTFGDKPRLRELILRRSAVPGPVRHALMRAVADSLGGFLVDGGFLGAPRKARVIEESLLQGTVTIARSLGAGLPDFIAYLREKAMLTPALLLRSGLGGDLTFINAALADLAEMEGARIAGILASRSEGSIAAITRRAGIPAFLAPVFVAVVRAAAMLPAGQRGDGFSLPVLHAAQAACAGIAGDDGLRLMALLRRYEAETARGQSRRIAEDLRRAIRVEQAPISLLPPDIGPEMLRLTMAEEAEPAARSPETEVLPRTSRSGPRAKRPRGIILDEPIPDLQTLIAEWKAEHAARDGLPPAPDTGNANLNEKPGRSRVA